MAQDKKVPQLTMVDLVASDAAGGVLNWRPARTGAFVVSHLEVDLTTVATAACTLDFGVAATGVSNDTLIDGMDANAATGEFCSGKSGGTNGKLSQKASSSQYVTGSMKTGAAAGLAGKAYIYWHAL